MAAERYARLKTQTYVSGAFGTGTWRIEDRKYVQGIYAFPGKMFGGMDLKIAVIGMGYVGLSIATLLSQHHTVTAVDILPEKVDLINQRISPFRDVYIEYFFKNKKLNLVATLEMETACKNANFVIIAVPTNYDSNSTAFDTSLLEGIIKSVIRINPEAIIIIKSTLPIGYTSSIQKKYHCQSILFSPEFLRESNALYDNLYPSRIVIGTDLENTRLKKAAECFANLLQESAIKKDIDVLIIGTAEAEAIKLFSNSYLAMRISFFNELDTYAEMRGLNARQIIDGVCMDPRIGHYYNNPSFGYGGYCLPKDTMQLQTHYNDIPGNLIEAITESNRIRKEFIARRVLELAKSIRAESHLIPVEDKLLTIGVYRLTTKSNSDNDRNSAVWDVIEYISGKNVKILVYEPILQESSGFGELSITSDLVSFKSECDLIIANRYDSCLNDVREKVYTRDLFNRD